MATTSTSPTVEGERVPPPQPHFINTVVELRGLSTSMSAFIRRYDDLQGHLEYIRNSIDSKLPKEISEIHLPEQLTVVSSTEIPSAIAAAKPMDNSEEKHMESESKFPNEVNKTTLPELKKALISYTETPSPNAAREPADNSEGKPMELALEALCQEMCGRDLQKYISTQLSNASKLREELPKALKCAANPAKLVLDSIGRFYLQGSSAYAKDPQMSRVREASVITLECFLLMGVDGVEIEPAVKQEADIAAEAWRKRLKDEGGIPKACELDARGLLFLISGFGVPRDFKHEPLRDLIRRCNPNPIYGVLRHSSHLISKIPGVLERMVRDKKHLGAVNMAYTFEIERFQLPVLRAFLEEMENVWIKAKARRAYTPLSVLNKANTNWLNNMSSVVTCLKQKGLDHSKLLPEWKLDEKISHLKKEVADIDREIKEKETEEVAKPKRKAANETEPLKKSKFKHLQHTGNAKTQQQKLSAKTQQKKVSPGFADRSLYDEAAQMNHLDGGFHGRINGYSASPSVYGDPYVWHRDESLSGRLVGPTFVGQTSSLGSNGMYGRPSPPPPPPPQIVGFSGLPDQRRSLERYPDLPDQHRSLERYPDLPDQRRSIERYPDFPDQHRSFERFAGLPDHHRSLEGFAGLPDRRPERVSGQSSASDLYHFADSVVEMESNRSGGGTFPAHHKYNF